MSRKKTELNILYLLERNQTSLNKFIKLIPMNNLFEDELKYIYGVISTNNYLLKEMRRLTDETTKNEQQKI